MKTVTIGALCSSKGCRRRGRYARRLSDFWVVWCEKHRTEPLKLDFSKIPNETGEEKKNAVLSGGNQRTTSK
jgi:hypothetical protein